MNNKKSPATTGQVHKWGILSAVSIALFLGSIDGSIVNVALPTLIDQLSTDFPTVQWVILAYLLGLTVLMVGMGRLADMIGERVVFRTGVILFIIGSAFCGFASDVYWLIGFRAFQSIGAAMVLALGVAIVTETWPGHERGKAIGITGSVISFGIVVGPTIGGFLLAWLHWRWIFYVNVPIGIIALVLIWLYVPDLKPIGRRERFDWLGALILGLGLLAFTLALTLGQYAGFNSPLVLFLFGFAVTAIVFFLWVERRARFPMVDMSLFGEAQFSLNLFTGWLTFVAIAGVVLLLPFYLELVMGLPLQRLGLMMALTPVLLALLQPFTGSLSDRLGTRPVTVVGLAIIVVGYLAMSTIQVDSSALSYVLRLVPVALGMATFQSPNNSAIMGSVPRPRLGVASGILSMVRTLGQLVGIAVLGAFFAWRLSVYGGPDVQIRDAAPDVIVHAIHDQFLFAAGLILVGFIVAVWTWRREHIAAQTAPAAPVPAQAPSSTYDSNTGS